MKFSVIEELQKKFSSNHILLMRFWHKFCNAAQIVWDGAKLRNESTWYICRAYIIYANTMQVNPPVRSYGFILFLLCTQVCSESLPRIESVHHPTSVQALWLFFLQSQWFKLESLLITFCSKTLSHLCSLSLQRSRF